ncbi:sugar ABC transporter permease [Mesorhizobium sp. M7A.F.Ca.US.011.01.1.1]|uniref:carbohydrate ABC transporter permease n=1 Tax=Mesorhizobium sp. M7A.F.Ca.US.011.01.1.1 TaxID=2496741 RepID=UPI001FE07F65|nr:sugar ABC transporter permease [Mesorhizobium sp. M7A.F.Ca.US.011.01.1.1]
MTSSAMFPKYDFVGLKHYVILWNMARWQVAVYNLLVFGVLYITITIILGLLIALSLDQRVRFEGLFRGIFLYPMAISFIVTGTAWKWILDPRLGIEKAVRDWGWSDFEMDWIVRPETAIYTLVIAAVWQSCGFSMAIFLAGLKGVPDELVKAADIDGASRWQAYRYVVLPTLTPYLFSVVTLLVFQAVRTFDLVVAMTGSGPGFSSDLPAPFMYQFAFGRNRLALAAASSVMILVAVAGVMVPYMIWQLRTENRDAR